MRTVGYRIVSFERFIRNKTNRITRKNAQVVTGLQTKLLQICSQAVNKLPSHCLFPVVATSLDQAINNL